MTTYYVYINIEKMTFNGCNLYYKKPIDIEMHKAVEMSDKYFYYKKTSFSDLYIPLGKYKYKTVRSLEGYDTNGGGKVELRSGLWMSTSAVNQIELTLSSNSFEQYSQFALYGIKG